MVSDSDFTIDMLKRLCSQYDRIIDPSSYDRKVLLEGLVHLLLQDPQSKPRLVGKEIIATLEPLEILKLHYGAEEYQPLIDEALRNVYSDRKMSVYEIAAEVGTSRSSLQRKLCTLGLRRKR